MTGLANSGDFCAPPPYSGHTLGASGEDQICQGERRGVPLEPTRDAEAQPADHAEGHLVEVPAVTCARSRRAPGALTTVGTATAAVDSGWVLDLMIATSAVLPETKFLSLWQ